MCGLCGYAGLPALNDPALIRTMTSRIAHRGPDDEGFYSDSHVAIGHRRLSIIDLGGGHQPMSSADGRYTLAYNGEIYNYRELRAVLEGRGRRLRTQSDTEVLLYWLVEFGRDRLLDLNGMFAAALWDKQERRFFLLRDRLGIKPLYFARHGQGLVFGSEIKALLPALPRPEADPAAIFTFMTFQNNFGAGTFFKGIEKLQPGHWLEWRAGGEIEIRRYWDLEFPEEGGGLSFPDAKAAYRETLEAAVRRHMIADVPVGSYLSGGIDSSSVAMLAAPQAAGRMHTFTGAFTDAAYYDEREGSRAVARAAGVEAHEVEISDRDFLNNMGRVIYHLDEPTLGTGALPGYMVSELVSKSVKVVLTGHGGDEMYAGYQVNKVALIRENLRTPWRLPGVMTRIRPDEWSRVLYYLLYPLLYPEVGHGLYIMVPRSKRKQRLAGEFLRAVGAMEPLDLLAPYLRAGETSGQRLFRLYLQTYLPTLFLQEDKVGMAHSIEARTPICDNAIVELATRMSLATKMEGGDLKAVPREAMRGVLPEILYRLPKRGFPTPLARWFAREPLKGLITDLITSQRTRARGVLNVDAMGQVLAEATSEGGKDNLHAYARANLLYSSAMVELWFRTFIDPTDPSPNV